MLNIIILNRIIKKKYYNYIINYFLIYIYNLKLVYWDLNKKSNLLIYNIKIINIKYKIFTFTCLITF